MECRIHSSNPHILNKIPTNKPKNSSNSSLFHAKFKTHKISSSLSSSNQTKLPASGTDTYTIEFKTRSNSRLGISWYPDFEYNAQGGRGTGVAKKTVDGDSDGDFSVNFDLETLYIPPLTSATTKFLGLPLPPFLRIDIVPEVFEGIIHKNSGKAECYHYVFDAAIKLNQLGLDWITPQHGPLPKSTAVVGGHGSVNMSVKLGSNGAAPSRRCIVLDIEGTTTPISFVSDVLFPYARTNVGRHLEASYETAETHDDIELLRTQVEDDLKQGIAGATPIPSKDMGKEEVIAALVANVEAMIKSDRKITALKQLQGHIWRTGFNSNELQGIVFDDVPKALKEWHDMGIKVYIYSSGSRLAQRLLFGNTKHGDLRKYLCGYFDTTVGGKKETISYVEISKSLGVDDLSEILFVTDVYQEAVAAKAAGWEVIISVRPGNGPLPENHGFMTVNSFSEI